MVKELNDLAYFMVATTKSLNCEDLESTDELYDLDWALALMNDFNTSKATKMSLLTMLPY